MRPEVVFSFFNHSSSRQSQTGIGAIRSIRSIRRIRIPFVVDTSAVHAHRLTVTMNSRNLHRAMRHAIAAIAVFASSVVAQTPSQTPAYDVVIRNGRVLDGAGNPWILADVA